MLLLTIYHQMQAIMSNQELTQAHKVSQNTIIRCDNYQGTMCYMES
jgi:hypothetical protein